MKDDDKTSVALAKVSLNNFFNFKNVSFYCRSYPPPTLFVNCAVTVLQI